MLLKLKYSRVNNNYIILRTITRAGLHRLELIDYIHPFNDLAEDDMSAVEPLYSDTKIQ